ncbi:MAG TPA: hypothetical protein VHX60_00735 [Acidobacteriaceae bacterium]|jgi:hypothetical protein|nr:hypothetical protein [Acidobacteriaceae bacterium]
MKIQLAFVTMILGCSLAGVAGAQTAQQPQNPRADWRMVERLSVGTAISVKGKGWHRFRCKVVEVEEQTLECQAEVLPGPNLFTPPVFHFSRSEIRQIRLEHPDATGAVAGMAVGTLGAVVGARGQGGPDPLGAILLGGLGGLIAAGIGHTFPVHGDVLYQR